MSSKLPLFFWMSHATTNCVLRSSNHRDLICSPNYNWFYFDYHFSTPALFKQWILEDIAIFHRHLNHRQQQSSSEFFIKKMKPFMELTKLSVWATRRQDWWISQGLCKVSDLNHWEAQSSWSHPYWRYWVKAVSLQLCRPASLKQKNSEPGLVN